jgi:hypothetical protein
MISMAKTTSQALNTEFSNIVNKKSVKVWHIIEIIAAKWIMGNSKAQKKGLINQTLIYNPKINFE